MRADSVSRLGDVETKGDEKRSRLVGKQGYGLKFAELDIFAKYERPAVGCSSEHGTQRWSPELPILSEQGLIGGGNG